MPPNPGLSTCTIRPVAGEPLGAATTPSRTRSWSRANAILSPTSAVFDDTAEAKTRCTVVPCGRTTLPGVGACAAADRAAAAACEFGAVPGGSIVYFPAVTKLRPVRGEMAMARSMVVELTLIG